VLNVYKIVQMTLSAVRMIVKYFRLFGV